MKNVSRRTFLQSSSGLAAASLLGLPPCASAQEAIRQLTILFGYPPGGAGDIVTRGVGDKITGPYAKIVVVENKPGAAGRLVMESVKRAPADGSALLITPSSVLALYPHVYKQLSYDSFADLTPVSTLCEFVHGFAVGPAVPESVKTLADFIGWCKANPDKASVGNPGEGSLPHFLTMLLSRAAGVKLEAIPYAGGPPGVRDLIGGQLPAMMATEGQFITFFRDGRLRMLATSGPARSRFSPGVATFAEEGFKEIVVSEWIGMFAPARTPAAIVERASAAVRTAITQPDLAEKFATFAIIPAPTTPAELGARLKADYDFWGPVIKSTGFTPIS